MPLAGSKRIQLYLLTIIPLITCFMMWRRITLLIAFLHAMLLMGQRSAIKISFTISMPVPASHQYQVAMRCERIKQDTVEFKMPVWMPGYYQIMNYPDK